MEKTRNARRSYTKQQQQQNPSHCLSFVSNKIKPISQNERERKILRMEQLNSYHQATWGEVSKKKQRKETKLSATSKTWAMVTSPDFSPTYSRLKMNFPLPYAHLTTEGKAGLNHTGWKKQHIKFPKIFHYPVLQPKLLFFKDGHGREHHRN